MDQARRKKTKVEERTIEEHREKYLLQRKMLTNSDHVTQPSSTPTTLNLYLTSLSYQAVPRSISPKHVKPDITSTFASLVNNSSLEVRAGYFGLYIRRGAAAGGLWVCSSDSIGLAGSTESDMAASTVQGGNCV